MKKKISIVMALIMFLNLFIFPNLFDQTALAASTYDFSAGFEQKLTEGKTNSIPQKENKHLTGGNAFMKWNIQTPTGGQFISGKFLLQYPLATGGIAQFVVEKNSTKATVTYDVFDANPAGTTAVQGSDKIYNNPISSITGNKYFVHTQHGAVLGQANYVPYNTFSNDGFANAYYVDITKVKPTFHINRGEGFSFQFENQTMHFLWDSTSNDFYFATDAFEQSKVFPVSLFMTTGINYTTAPSKLNISTGISNANIQSIPKSNNNTLQDVLDHTGVTTPVQNPAQDDNLMEIRMKIPEVWDLASNSFKVGSEAAAGIGFKIDLANNTQNHIQVIIDNIFKPSTSTVSGTTFKSIPTRVTATGTTYDENGEFILFTLGKMSYGQIFEATTNFTEKDAYYFNYNKIDFGKFYTFLKYSISYIGDKYYAIIEPYRGYSGYYRLLVDGNKSVTSYSDGLSSIYMPLSLQPNSTNIYSYQIMYSPGVTFESGATQPIYSQKMNYKAGPESLSIGIPSNFQILDHTYIPWDETSSDTDKDVKGHLRLKLLWEIGREETIKALVDKSASVDAASNKKIQLKYKLYSTLQPYALNPDGTADTRKVNVLTTIVMDIEREGTSPDYRYKVTYSEEKKSPSTAPMLVFDEIDATRYFKGVGSNKNDSMKSEPSGDIIYMAFVMLDTLAFNKNAISNTTTPTASIDFYFPNIYFLNVQPLEITRYTGIEGAGIAYVENLEKTVGASLYNSMTLDDYSRLNLPTPQNLTAYDAITTTVSGKTTEVSMKVKWLVPGEKIKEYFDHSQKYDKNDIGFNLYISQTEKDLKLLSSIKVFSDRIKPPVVAIPFKDIYSDLNGETGEPGTEFAIHLKTLRDELRNGKVVCITGIPANTDPTIVQSIFEGTRKSYEPIYKLDGLDKNQKYYFSMDMVADFSTKEYNNDVPPVPTGNYILNKTTNSMMTNITTETTQGDENNPSPEDKFPPAPILTKEDVSLSSAKILWDKISEPNPNNLDLKFEYEIIRLKDKPLDESMLDSRTDFNTFFNTSIKNDGKIGLQTSGTSIKEFNGSSFVAPATGKYDYNAVTGNVALIDGTLSPNQLYFYYVRTARIINTVGADGVAMTKTLYSVWSNISVTTTPVRPPIKLVVERSEQKIKYNKEKQFVISFDAPLADIAALGRDFELQYAIKKDNGDWSPQYTMITSELSNADMYSISATKGFIHFKYVVSKMYENGKWVDLAAGSSYSIHVRIFDLKNNDASIYSNTAEARTEMNQEEYDKNIISDEWLKYLEDELSKIKKEYYWYAKDTTSETIIIYRPDMFNELLTNSEGSQLELVKTDSFKSVYYLPASAILSANEMNKGFKIVNSDMDVVLSPNALDANYNDAFIKIAERIKDKAIKDYYVKITISKQISNKYVEGYTALSHQTEISVETVGNITTNIEFDNDIFELLKSEVEKQATSNQNADKIKKMLEDKESNENLVKFIADLVKDVRKDFANKVEKSFDKTVKSYFVVTNLAMPLILRYANNEQGMVVKGYQSTTGIWVSKDVIVMDGIHSMSTNSTGTFIFAGSKIYLPKIDGVSGAEDITNLIIKYGLDDYLGKSEAFRLDSNVTGYMVMGVTARLMGASKTSDPNTFLKEKGYTISTRTNASSISKQDTIYLLMAVYEAKTNTKIASIKISNYSITANVKNLNDKNIQAVKVAYQLGIVTDKNMDAKSNITVAEFLNMLLKLKDKAKL